MSNAYCPRHKRLGCCGYDRTVDKQTMTAAVNVADQEAFKPSRKSDGAFMSRQIHSMAGVPVVNMGQQLRRNGPAAPPASMGQRWWNHHIQNTRAYAERVMAGDVPGAVAAVGELWKAVLDWQKITGSPVAGVLMAEHTALAKMLADGFAEGRGGAWTSSAVEALVKNVETQGQLFPVDPQGFVGLFGPHTELAGAYITDLANGDMEAFQGHFAEALRNGAELAAWTDRTFGPGVRAWAGMDRRAR